MIKALAGLSALLAVLSVVLFVRVGDLEGRLATLETRPSPPPPPDETDAPEADAPILERLAWLEGKVARLEYRGTGPGPRGNAPPGHRPEEGPPARGVIAGSGAPSEVIVEALESDDPVVREKLAEVFREEQERLEQERSDRRMDNRLDRLKKEIAELAEKAGLSTQDTVWLTDRLSAESYEIRDMWRAARENGTWHETREKMTEVREHTEAEVKDVLEEDAYAEFKKMRDEEVARFRGFGGGRRGRRAADDEKKAEQ